MKKSLKLLAPVLLIVMVLSLCVSALSDINANEQKLLALLDQSFQLNGNVYVVPDEIKAVAKNYLVRNDVDINEETAAKAIAAYADFKKTVEATGVKELKDLTGDQKSAIISKIDAGAAVLNLTVSVDSTAKTVSILDDSGTVVCENITAQTPVKKTGAESFATVAVVAAVLSVLGCAVVLGKKVND